MIEFKDFLKLDLKVGTIKEAEKIENADKLLKLIIDFGDEQRQVVAGIAEAYKPEELIDMQVPVLLNLEPRKIRGVESNGMILAAHDENDLPVVLNPNKPVDSGSKIQ